MKVIVTIQHGGNVHFFKHLIRELEAADHDVYVYAREQEVVGNLLDAYDIGHELLCGEPNSLLGLGLTQIRYELQILRRARAIDPDYIISSHGIAASHVAMLVGAESHIYIDTETAINHGNRLTTPFADAVYTPASFREDLGDDHVRYPGYHELAYLHPDRFEPDPAVLRRNGVDPDDRYAVVRRGAFDSNHDVGKSGISPEGYRRIVDDLAADGAVYVSDEGNDTPPPGAEPIPVSPADFHHLLAFADLVVGDVATSTLEAGVLGTPTVRISPFAGTSEMGKFLELESYGLIRSFSTADEAVAIETIERLYRDSSTDERWTERREAFLDDMIDVTGYVASQLGVDVRDEPTVVEHRPDERTGRGRATDGRPSVPPADDPIPGQ